MKEYLFLITDNFPFGFGEEFIQNEIDYLSKAFKKIFIITTNQNDNQTKDIPSNFEVYRIKKEKIGLINLLKKEYILDFFSEKITLKNLKLRVSFIYTGYLIKETILNIIKKEKINTLNISLYSYWFYSGAYAISKIKIDKVIKISRAHRYDLYNERGEQPLKNKILSELDWVLPCSIQGANYLKERYPKFKSKIEYSYLGINNFNELKIKENNFNIISCSYIRPVKRVYLIIEALEKLKLYDKKITWIHIGDGEDLEQLKKLAQEKLQNINFKFLGHLKNSEILEYYKKNDIKCFINLSSSEGLPVSMMEVQSFGIPIVATNVGGVKEIVSNKTGVLLEENPTPEEVAQGIEKIISLKVEEYKNLQKSCYENWNEKFNAKKNYSKFIEKYLKGLNNEK